MPTTKVAAMHFLQYVQKVGAMIKKFRIKAKSRKKDKIVVSYEHFPHFHSHNCMEILYIARQMDKKLNKRPCVHWTANIVIHEKSWISMAKNSIPAAMDCIHFYGHSIDRIRVKLLKILILSYPHLHPPNPSSSTVRVWLKPTWRCQNYILSKTPLAQTKKKQKKTLSKNVAKLKRNWANQFRSKHKFFFGHKKPVVHTNVFCKLCKVHIKKYA